MRLEGKRTLITGAGSGIGRALALEASRLGMKVALCGRRAEALAETLSEMTPSGQHLRLRGDITDPAVRRGMRDYLWRQWGGLDVLVNNAGIIAVGPLACATDAEFEQMMATNVIAPLALTREMLPLLRRAMPSRVVNVGSMFGDIPYPLFAAYSASKFALRGLSIALRRELRAYGVGVTYAAPRATRTDASRSPRSAGRTDADADGQSGPRRHANLAGSGQRPGQHLCPRPRAAVRSCSETSSAAGRPSYFRADGGQAGAGLSRSTLRGRQGAGRGPPARPGAVAQGRIQSK